MENVNDEHFEDVRLSASETECANFPTKDWHGSWPNKDWVRSSRCSLWGLPVFYETTPHSTSLLETLQFYDKCFRQDGISDGGQAKKRKLETDPLCFSDPSEPSSSHGDRGDAINSEEDVVLPDHRRIFNFSVELANCNAFQNDKSPKQILDFMKDNSVALHDDPCQWIDQRMDSNNPFFHIHSFYPSPQEILDVMKGKVDAPLDPYPWIERKLDFKDNILYIHSLYEAVKRFYENVPYIMGYEKLERVKKIVDMKSPPFHLLDEFQLASALEIYRKLRCRIEVFFHPLLRKSYKNEFFSIVDDAEELAKRQFVMMHWRTTCPGGHERLFLQLSRTKGLRDEKYMYCCNQIKLQESFDLSLYLERRSGIFEDLVRSEHILLPLKHDSIITYLMGIEAVVPKIFTVLHPELIQLSLEVLIKSCSQEAQQKRAYVLLQSLEDARCKDSKATNHIDEMLKGLHSEFPLIFELSQESLKVDDALEERFRDVVHKMKEMWFSNIADHYVAEVTLLYIKHLVSEIEPAASRPTIFIKRRMRGKIRPDEICHRHWMYQHVMDVEFSLP